MKKLGQTNEEIFDKEFSDIEENGNSFLILHNDDFNTFDFVIDALIEVCKHDSLQAEQCAMLVHFKGKCDVKKGNFAKLKTMKDKLISKGLSATID